MKVLAKDAIKQVRIQGEARTTPVGLVLQAKVSDKPHYTRVYKST